VIEANVGELVGHDAGRDTPPEPRRLEHVRFVDRSDALSPSACQLRGNPDDPLDLRGRVDANIARALSAVGGDALLGAEVDATRQFPNNDEVDTDQRVGPEGRGVRQLRERLDRSKVGEHAEHGANGEQALLGPDSRRRIVPPGAANRAEQHGVGSRAGRDRFFRQRAARGVDGGTTDQCFREVECHVEASRRRVEDRAGGGYDFRADPVAGKQDDGGMSRRGGLRQSHVVASCGMVDTGA